MNRHNSSAAPIIITIVVVLAIALIGLLCVGGAVVYMGIRSVHETQETIARVKVELAQREVELDAAIAEAEAQDKLDELNGLNVEIYQAKVVGVSDGDTISLLRDGKEQSVRLYGIDCPEIGQAFGEKAKQLTTQLCLDKDVLVRVEEKDLNGRDVVQMYLVDERKDINWELLKAGLAWLSPDIDDEHDLKLMSGDDAQEDRIGLWADDEPVPPWIWRENQELQQN